VTAETADERDAREHWQLAAVAAEEAVAGTPEQAPAPVSLADARPETVVRDGDGDRWTLDDTGRWSCPATDESFASVADLDRIYGPLVLIALPVDAPVDVDPWIGHPLWQMYGGPDAPRCETCRRPYSPQEARAGMTTCAHCPPAAGDATGDDEGEDGR
jgi:hypothetical protein